MNKILQRLAYIRKTDTVLDDYTIKVFCQKYKVTDTKFYNALKSAIQIYLNKMFSTNLNAAKKVISRILDEELSDININELTNKLNFEEFQEHIKKELKAKMPIPFNTIVSAFDTHGLDDIIRYFAQIITYSRGFSVSSINTTFGKEIFKYIADHKELVSLFNRRINYMINNWTRWYSPELYNAGRSNLTDEDEKNLKKMRRQDDWIINQTTGQFEQDINKEEYYKNKDNGRIAIDNISSTVDKLGQELEVNNTFFRNDYSHRAWAIIDGQLYTNSNNPFAYKNIWLNKYSKGKSIDNAMYVLGYITKDNDSAIIVETHKLVAGTTLAAVIKSKLNVKKVYAYKTANDVPNATIIRLAKKL